MKNIGEFIKYFRLKKKLSREKLEAKTKIKKEFIEAIENLKWDELPDYSVVSGFVKSIAKALNQDEKRLSALLRRDYPPREIKVSPKPQIKEKFKWSPKSTFITGIAAVFILIFIYLGFSYLSFISPPQLELQEPYEGQTVEKSKVVIKGKTDPEASLIVNSQPVIVGEDGYFDTEIEIFEGTREVVVVSQSRSGKETVIRRNIVPKLVD